MVRLVVQQSNCFIITSLGNQRMESRISGITQYQRNSGEFRAGSNQQMGQRVAADYFLEPAILFAGDTTSGLTGGLGGLGGLGGRWGGLAAGALGGALRSNSTNVTMSLVDIRSGVQIASSEGSSTATNLGASLAGLGSAAAPRSARGWAASPARRRAKRRWRPSWTPTTSWWPPPATTAPNPSAAAPAPAGCCGSTGTTAGLHGGASVCASGLGGHVVDGVYATPTDGARRLVRAAGPRRGARAGASPRAR